LLYQNGRKSFKLGLRVAWRSIEHVNDRYSEEEIKNLLDMLKSRGINRFDLSYRWGADRGVRLVGLSLIPEACECFSDSLHNMPLYINHPKEEVQVIAAWRLKYAR
jgi:hypothetical protein